MAHGKINVKAAGEELGVYEMYKDYSEQLSKIADHRVLAINRGENEEFLKVSIDCDFDKAMFIIAKNSAAIPNTKLKISINNFYFNIIIKHIFTIFH